MASRTHGRKSPGFLGPYQLSRCKQTAVSASSVCPGISSTSSVKHGDSLAWIFKGSNYIFKWKGCSIHLPDFYPFILTTGLKTGINRHESRKGVTKMAIRLTRQSAIRTPATNPPAERKETLNDSIITVTRAQLPAIPKH